MVALNEKNETSNEFDFGQEFESKGGEIYPFAQLINPSSPIALENGDQIIQPYGLAIRQDNAEKVGLFDLEKNNWKLVDYQFVSGSVEKLWITREPRILVIRKTPVFILDRATKKVLGQFDKRYNKLLHKTFTEVFVLILGKNNNLLHSVQADEFDSNTNDNLPIPLKLKLGGAGGSRFGVSYKSWDTEMRIGKGFIHELEAAYSKLRGLKTVKKMNTLWHAHGVFAPTITSKPAGNPPNVKNVCDFSKYEVPTPETLGDNLIKANTELSKFVVALHNKFESYVPKVGGDSGIDEDLEYITTKKSTAAVPASAYMAGTNIISEDDADMPPY